MTHTAQENAMTHQITNIEQLLTTLFRPGDLIEIRGHGKYNSAGLFTDFRLAAEAAKLLNDEGLNVYFSSNPIDPQSKHAVATQHNKLFIRAKSMAGNEDITERRYYMLDIDPIRESGRAATDAEVAAATVVLERLKRELKDAGLPAPVIIFSGNGYHLLIKAEGGNPDRAIYRFVLKQLHELCSDEHAHMDIAVHDLKRGVRMPFCRNRKGESTPKRPHRLASIVEFPELVMASNAMMRAFAKEHGYVDHLRGNQARLSKGIWELCTDEEEVEEFCEQYLNLAKVTHEGDVTYFGLAECPFAGRAHRDQMTGHCKTVLMLTGDKLIFKCFSSDCEEYWIKDLMELIEEEEGDMPYEFWCRVDDEDEQEQFDEAVERWGGCDQLPTRPDVSTWADKYVVDYGNLTCNDMRDEFIRRAIAEDATLTSPAQQEVFRAEANRILAENDAVEMGRWLGRAKIDEIHKAKTHLMTGEEFAAMLAAEDAFFDRAIAAKDWAAIIGHLGEEECRSRLVGATAKWVPEFRDWFESQIIAA